MKKTKEEIALEATVTQEVDDFMEHYTEEEIAAFAPITEQEMQMLERKARLLWPTFWLIHVPPYNQKPPDNPPPPDDYARFNGKDVLRLIIRIRELEAKQEEGRE